MALTMARVLKPSNFQLLKSSNNCFTPKANFSINNVREALKRQSRRKKIAIGVTSAVTTGAIGVGLALHTAVFADDLILHPPSFPWSHKRFYKAYDHSSIRRGYFVYKQVCAACHSIEFSHYRNLVNVCFSEEEAKAEAAEIMVRDGPNDEGEMFLRPGKLFDKFPKPYDNEEAAKTANNGAVPPDLNLIVKARHGGEDYIFSLLTGYCEAPAGVEMAEDMHYNPYFPGGAIGMAEALYNEIIEYPDGTPATQSQLAKDVCTFLAFLSDPNHDTRKRIALKVMSLMGIIGVFYWVTYRQIWVGAKQAKMLYKPNKYPKKYGK